MQGNCRKDFNYDLANFDCPRVNCDGVLMKANGFYACSKCEIKVKNREDFWEKVKILKQEACIDVLNRTINGL